MDSSVEILVLQLRSEAEALYLSKECREKVINDAVKITLELNLRENKISSTDYQQALDILKRYETKIDQV